jgi:hypothetical protein
MNYCKILSVGYNVSTYYLFGMNENRTINRVSIVGRGDFQIRKTIIRTKGMKWM